MTTIASRSLAALVLMLFPCAIGIRAYAGPPPASVADVAQDFGSPPSGDIPILYNDQHVYSAPDELKQSRVLGAIVKDGTLLVPLRSMFEQMGATVSWDAASQSVTVQKPGADVQVTVGKSEIVINGETRPLDVPPEIYHGVVVVPVRVLSESLGAYVLWVPDRRICVVRYLPPMVVPTAPPTMLPTAPPTPMPAPTPAPTPTPTPSYTFFVEGAFASSVTYNEFSAGRRCCTSYVAGAAYAPENSAFAVKVDYREDTYVTSDDFTDPLGNHYTSFATIDGGTALVPVFKAKQSTLDARLEFRIASPRIFVGVGYLQAENSYGYPHLSGVGAGIEKLPDLQPGIGLFGSAFYYPTATGNFTVTDPNDANVGKSYRQQYQLVNYDIGLSLVFGRSPVYLYGGFSGDRYLAKENAPIGQTHSGPYIGLGVKF